MPRKRFFHTCVRKTECLNPNQGQLTEDDYAPTPSGGRQVLCLPCAEVSIEERKYKPSTATPLNHKDVANSSIKQRWLCGLIGSKGNMNDIHKTLLGRSYG